LKKLLAGLAALATAAAALGLLWFGYPGEPVEVAVPPGLSASQTASLLEAHGVLRLGIVFRAAAKLSGMDRKLKPGSYRLRRGMSVGAVLNALSEGINTDVKVVIPEGFSARQIAERLEVLGICKGAEFLRYVEANRLEGYLFPTTYHFTPACGAEKAARRLQAEFQRQIFPLYAAAVQPRHTLHQVLTLASIIQREAVLPEEMPMIAAVYYNRMRLRMRLEADPTVQYALGYWKKGLTLKDLQNPSPYNTYNHYGLPPGPICNPGVEAVKAALNPARTQALFFVADTTGGHVFSSSIEEHLKAKQDFKRKQRVINRQVREMERARR
jgi:UPF0755 protein